jgi:ABC-2 type transport system permease protein
MVLSHLLSAATDRPLKELFMALALYARHFPPFQTGQIHLRDVVYYVALTYVALFAAIRVMEARRWK